MERSLGGVKAVGTHASKRGPGRMGAGGCASGAWAKELVLGRAMCRCLQIVMHGGCTNRLQMPRQVW